MLPVFWTIVVLFLLGFMHGLHSSHVEEILARYSRDDFYRKIERISLESAVDHLRLFSLAFLPMIFIRVVLPGFDKQVIVLLVSLVVFVTVHLYLFFFRKVSLHQHDHPHVHSHGHDHNAPEPHIPSLHTDHNHSLSREVDDPPDVTASHRHDHRHHHSHLHVHRDNEDYEHQHKHYPKIMERLLELRNFSVLLLLAAFVISLSPGAGVAGMAVFLLGTYLSVYLLNIIYMAGGIRLMERCISFSDLLSGVVGLVVFYFS